MRSLSTEPTQLTGRDQSSRAVAGWPWDRPRGCLALLTAGLIVLLVQGRTLACVNYPDYLHWVGSVDVISPQDVAVSNQTAYVVAWSYGFHAVDVSDPSRPRILGSVDTPGEAKGVALAQAGGFAYVGDGSAGLEVIEISNPAQPRIVGP